MIVVAGLLDAPLGCFLVPLGGSRFVFLPVLQPGLDGLTSNLIQTLAFVSAAVATGLSRARRARLHALLVVRPDLIAHCRTDALALHCKESMRDARAGLA